MRAGRRGLGPFAVACGSLLLSGCGTRSIQPPANVTPAVPSAPSRVIVTGPMQSIRQWAACDGVTDDSAAVAQAFAAASKNAFVLQIDCPVFLHVGMDVARPIFIDNGTHVDFTEAGLIILDNALVPSFVLADTSDVRLTNWKIRYSGGLPVDPYTGGYFRNGAWVSQNGQAPASHIFSDDVLTPWLTAHRGVIFRGANAAWHGPSELSALFYLWGSTSGVSIENMQVAVPQTASPDRYVPVVFAMDFGQTENQTVTRDQPAAEPQVATPGNLTFTGITLDGTDTGWAGFAHNVTLTDVVSYRYGDLQDAAGNNVGGVGLWFAPPHLIYLSGNTAVDPSLLNHDIVIQNVMDYGQRSGVARDVQSGNCYSLKLSAAHASVSHYTSYRPDGFMDVLFSSDLLLQDIVSVSDSSFDRYAYPIIRFPAGPYRDVTFANMQLQDLAGSTAVDPVWGNSNPSNSGIVFAAVSAQLNRWTGARPPGYSPTVPGTPPYFGGTGNSVDVAVSHQ